MRLNKAIGVAALAGAVAALVAACGGGGGGGSDVRLSGVAATGLALANSTVDVKCASGTGTASTDGSGAYTVTVANGALPCIVKVSGTANGVPVTLHSIAEGTGNTATANVTPLTEMIVARAAGTTPAALFDSFSGTAVTSATLAQATTDIITVVRDALGVDLSGIDPFKAPLVAATPSNLSGGNGYDQLLDQLKTKVSTEMLPQVVSQIASTVGSAAPLSLSEVVANVSKGSLAGCPAALSGKYRLLDYIGESQVVDIDFSAMKLTADDGPHAITANSGQACEFTIAGTTTVMIGSSGAGVTRDAQRAGFIFPVQSHALASALGKWEFLESGIEEVSEGNSPRHWVGEMDIAADGKVTVCDYEGIMSNDFSSCTVDTEDPATIQAQSDGTFILQYGASQTHVYGFRAPGGQLTLFGTNNPGGSFDPEVLKTSFVLTRPQTATASPVGTVSKFWDVVQRVNVGSGSPVLVSPVPARNSNTVTASTDTSVTRKLTSSGSDNGRVDTLTLNSPINGMRSRPTGTDTSTGTSISYNAVVIRNLPGTQISIALDMVPDAHFMSYTVTRP